MSRLTKVYRLLRKAIGECRERWRHDWLRTDMNTRVCAVCGAKEKLMLSYAMAFTEGEVWEWVRCP